MLVVYIQLGTVRKYIFYILNLSQINTRIVFENVLNQCITFIFFHLHIYSLFSLSVIITRFV